MYSVPDEVTSLAVAIAHTIVEVDSERTLVRL